MEFRILGPLEVLSDARPLDLGGRKQRTLLAVLLLEANRVVSVDRLIEVLWPDETPGTAPKALQVYISQLRKQLGPERLQTKAPGYLLRIAEGELDLERVRRLREEGRLLEALSLWRGPPLADFAYESFAQGEIVRLEELRLACLEERIEADLAGGRHGELVGELEALVREHPLRERPRTQLMLSLYRSGRQAEALEAYQSARATLVEELGIEPGKTLRELEQAILRQDPALELEAPPGVPEEPQSAPAHRSPTPPGSGREVRKIVTVLFADVTPVGDRLDPELLRRVAGRAFEEMRRVLERHGGSVEKLVRGAMTAVFGIPVVHEDDALRAVRAAAEMREQLAVLNDELTRERGVRLALRTGLSTGEVVAGGAQEGEVVGEAVTAAAGLQQSARADEILIGPETHRFVRDAILAEPSEPEAAQSPLRLLAVVRGTPGQRSRFQSPMVGRSRERQRLQDVFEQAVGDASSQLFTILGAAGVGKSRLVQEFLDDLGEQALVARGRCLSYGEGITFWPLIEAFREAATLDEGDTPEQARRKLAALLENEADAELIAQRVAELIGLTEAEPGAEEGFWAVRMLFEALARRRPLVLVFDDIHWGETTFLDLVEHVADWTREVPLLLICIARPELLDVRAGWGGGKLNATAVLLEPLSEKESSQLIDNLAEARLDTVTRRRVIEAAEGNPLFVEEMLALAREDGHENGELEVPPTINALLAARIDRLADSERWVLECASVEGKVFHQGAVAELSPVSFRPQVPTNVAALVRKELIRPDRALFAGERGFRFRHLLIRDAAYESLPKEARAELHERYAGWLEQKAGERTIEWEEIIGYHLEQACRYWSELGPLDETAREIGRRAAGRLGAARRRAFGRNDAPAAVNLISRAAALLPADDPARVDLVPNVRVVQGSSADLSWADSILSQALETGDERLKAHALVQRGFLRLFTEPKVSPDDLLEVAREAIVIFEDIGDALGLARAWRLVAQSRYLARRAAESAEASEQALVHARRAQDSFEVREIVEWLAVALTLGSTPASEALRRCERLLEEAAGDRFLEVTLLSVRAYLEATQGRAEVAEELLAEATRAGGDPGYLNKVAYFSVYVGLLRLLAGEAVAAEHQLRAGCQALEEVGEKTNYSTVSAMLARALCAQGRYAEAEAFTRASEEAARPNDVFANVTWRSVRATVLGRQGKLQAAEAQAREAVGFAAQSDFLDAHGDALVDLAEVLRLMRRPQEARGALEEAARLYEQKENVVSTARARSLLEKYA